MKSFAVVSVLVAALFASSASASAVPLQNGHVTWVEATYLPGYIVFALSTGDSTCPAGRALTWSNGSVDNMKAVYASLLISLLTNRPLYAYYSTESVQSGPWGTNACMISYIGST